VEECLPSKCEALNSTPVPQKKFTSDRLKHRILFANYSYRQKIAPYAHTTTDRNPKREKEIAKVGLKSDSSKP
jgi:hypothetical protein